MPVNIPARFGGPEGNEILTSAIAVVLIGLLVAEGVTVIHMGGLVTAHMFIGLVLIPPVLLKLATTGYRFGRYYTGSRAYRAKGPPAASATGDGARARRDHAGRVRQRCAVTRGRTQVRDAAGDPKGELHSLVGGFCAAPPRLPAARGALAARRLGQGAASSRPRGWPAGMLVMASFGGGVALALSLVSTISGWQS